MIKSNLKVALHMLNKPVVTAVGQKPRISQIHSRKSWHRLCIDGVIGCKNIICPEDIESRGQFNGNGPPDGQRQIPANQMAALVGLMLRLLTNQIGVLVGLLLLLLLTNQIGVLVGLLMIMRGGGTVKCGMLNSQMGELIGRNGLPLVKMGVLINE